jgi:hypothetical protein
VDRYSDNNFMDDNFKCFYRILRTLEQALDLDDFDMEAVGYERLKISENRWCHYMEMLVDEGYIKGINITRYVDGGCKVSDCGIRITLKGLEYLSENSIMQRLYKAGMNAKNLIG